MKVALVYDRVNKFGGAERLLVALHRIFPNAPLYTSVYNPKTASWAKSFEIKTSFIQKIPFAAKRHELFALLMPIAFENFDFDDYDLVISISSEAAKGIITKPHTRHISIILTPTRYLWSSYDDYFKNKLLNFFTTPFVWYLKTWDKAASGRPDLLISISKEVEKRVKKYYGRASKLIYPPIMLEKEYVTRKPEDFFLVTSRLVPYKRVQLAIEACNNLSIPLKIVGAGSEKKKLQKISGPTIEFLGNVSEKELISFYSRCKALIFPGIEDFGLVMVEAQMAGAPVIAFGEGGAKEIVREGVTGEFFDKPKACSLELLLKTFDASRYNTKDCQNNAKRFSFESFKKEIESVVWA